MGMPKPISRCDRSLGIGKRSGLVSAEYQATSLRKEMSSSVRGIPSIPATSLAQSTSLLWVWP